MKSAALLLALFIALPATALNPGTYRMSVTLELVRDLDLVRIKCAIMGGDPLLVHGWVGCSKKYAGFCHIVAVPPQSWMDGNRVLVLGHELMHCAGEKSHG